VSHEPPRGSFQARVDDKGRLKLPAVFLDYLSDLGEKKVFITSLDAVTGRIYPISVWKENEKLFDAASEEPEAAADVVWVANHFGADSEIDAQGRVLVPTDLRRYLKIENESVWLDSYKGRINVYSGAEYEQRKVRALANLGEKLKALERRGLK
jgi:MraZ protein